MLWFEGYGGRQLGPLGGEESFSKGGRSGAGQYRIQYDLHRPGLPIQDTIWLWLWLCVFPFSPLTTTKNIFGPWLIRPHIFQTKLLQTCLPGPVFAFGFRNIFCLEFKGFSRYSSFDNSPSLQFFITLRPTPWLAGRFHPIGHLSRGFQVTKLFLRSQNIKQEKTWNRFSRKIFLDLDNV